MEELKKINRILEKEYPDAYRETLVVLDATTGQNALAQARQFSEVAEITGIILTKDGRNGKKAVLRLQSTPNLEFRSNISVSERPSRIYRSLILMNL